jgi:hypothetical protein
VLDAEVSVEDGVVGSGGTLIFVLPVVNEPTRSSVGKHIDFPTSEVFMPLTMLVLGQREQEQRVSIWITGHIESIV